LDIDRSVSSRAVDFGGQRNNRDLSTRSCEQSSFVSYLCNNHSCRLQF
jgi:hypothetical protein